MRSIEAETLINTLHLSLTQYSRHLPYALYDPQSLAAALISEVANISCHQVGESHRFKINPFSYKETHNKMIPVTTMQKLHILHLHVHKEGPSTDLRTNCYVGWSIRQSNSQVSWKRGFNIPKTEYIGMLTDDSRVY